MALLSSPGARAELSCENESALLTVNWDSLPLALLTRASGEWRLPVSAGRPDRLTEARVRLSFEQSPLDGQWTAKLDFSFPDPKPYGIPFTFQMAELAWETPAGPMSARLDWSSSCTEAGRSLFPRGSWSATVGLPGSIGQSSLDHAVFRVWGSRN